MDINNSVRTVVVIRPNSEQMPVEHIVNLNYKTMESVAENLLKSIP